jgi:hypothetical protein
MTRTYRHLYTFLVVAQKWLSDHPQESKFRYALRKVVKHAEKLWSAYQEQVEELDIEHAATGERDVILKDQHGQIAFTKDGLRARNKARKALFDSDVSIEPYFAKDVPELTDAEREAFTGFVLKDEASAPESENIWPGPEKVVTVP